MAGFDINYIRDVKCGFVDRAPGQPTKKACVAHYVAEAQQKAGAESFKLGKQDN